MRSKAVQTNGSTTRIDVATAIGTNARVLLDTASEISYFVGFIAMAGNILFGFIISFSCLGIPKNNSGQFS